MTYLEHELIADCLRSNETFLEINSSRSSKYLTVEPCLKFVGMGVMSDWVLLEVVLVIVLCSSKKIYLI